MAEKCCHLTGVWLIDSDRTYIFSKKYFVCPNVVRSVCGFNKTVKNCPAGDCLENTTEEEFFTRNGVFWKYV